MRDNTNAHASALIVSLSCKSKSNDTFFKRSCPLFSKIWATTYIKEEINDNSHVSKQERVTNKGKSK